ncbi:NUDIX domain-containing protein [Kribbella steppae]|uniref:NUDIX domain-containing protein n=1 Tax=Kribbella steppae TaxID=2512223 RepID=A0A4R2H1B9_9ACTN|nr:NUDIX domain-containing protein [Kribbella steppae]TCO18487.1 NUDIX domain-containing protein [Kribbella steppae]
MRAGIVLLTRDGVAAIERVRDGMTYHVLPGGQVEDGESAAEAARREAFEELGVLVKIRGLVAVVHFGLRTQQYFLAEQIGGEFGTGDGPELGSSAESERGSYRAVWLPVSELVERELKPKPIAATLTGAPDPEWLLDGWLESPVVFEEV